MKVGLKKVVFLDRDGVINRDSEHYIKSWAEFEFLPGSLPALKKLNDNGFTVIVITNQSGINRRLFSLQTLEDIHDRMKTAVRAHGGHIRDIFFCPHTPEEGCECRKPQPGLILSARRAFGIDLASACMVGDSAKDVECAINAGCQTTVLVKTGNGRSALAALARKNIIPDFVAADLQDAADWIVARP